MKSPSDWRSRLVDARAAGLGTWRRVYAEYLNTGVWKRVRRAALQRAGHKCVMCGTAERLQVHHVSYERVGAEAAQDLRVLCHSSQKRIWRHLPRHAGDVITTPRQVLTMPARCSPMRLRGECGPRSFCRQSTPTVPAHERKAMRSRDENPPRPTTSTQHLLRWLYGNQCACKRCVRGKHNYIVKECWRHAMFDRAMRYGILRLNEDGGFYWDAWIQWRPWKWGRTTWVQEESARSTPHCEEVDE